MLNRHKATNATALDKPLDQILSKLTFSAKKRKRVAEIRKELATLKKQLSDVLKTPEPD